MDRQQIRYRVKKLLENLKSQREAELLRSASIAGASAASSVLVLVFLDDNIKRAESVLERIPVLCTSCGHRYPERAGLCLPCMFEN